MNRNWRKQVGFPRSNRGRPFGESEITSARRTQAMALKKEGMTQRAIGRRLGVSRQYVQQLLSPEKAFARAIAQTAHKYGFLKSPEACEECGIAGKLQKHHPDYKRPLFVKWLCADCHHELHALERTAA